MSIEWLTVEVIEIPELDPYETLIDSIAEAAEADAIHFA